MSSSYSANQYDGAFKSQRLQNWSASNRFKEGTWDLPARIPARINPTGRSVEGLSRLKSWGFEPLHTGRPVWRNSRTCPPAHPKPAQHLRPSWSLTP
ncbi:hypothetical protein PAMA_021201 [Pampus argenteus]